MGKLDVLRIYDQVIYRMVAEDEERLTIDGQSVPTVFATPERAQLGVLKKLGMAPKDKVPYPYVSIARISSVPDHTRRGFAPARYIHWNEPLQTIAQSRYPLPWNFIYQLDFWSRHRNHTNQAWQWISILFKDVNELRPMTVDFREPWGVFKYVPLFLTELMDASELETQERERVMRVTTTLTFKGWMLEAYDRYQDIPLDNSNKPTTDIPQTFTRRIRIVRKSTIDYRDQNDTVTLGRLEVGIDAPPTSRGTQYMPESISLLDGVAIAKG